MKYKIGISFLFLSLLFGTPIEADPKSEGFCGLHLLLLAKHYVQQVPGGRLNPTEIPKNEWVISETDGLVQIESFEPITGRIDMLVPSRFALVSRKAYPETSEATRGRFARLGTAAARQLTEQRTLLTFTHPENMEYFYALKGILAIRANFLVRSPSVILLEKIWEEVRPHHSDLGDFNQALILWKELYSFKRAETPKMGWEKRLQALKDFTEEYYRQTGHNLVQGGVLTYEPTFTRFGTVNLTGGAISISREEQRPLLEKIKSEVLGGDGTDIPLDVYQHLLMETWKSSERRMNSIGPSHLWGARLEKGSELAEKTDRLKASGDLTELEYLLNEISMRSDFQAFQENIPKDALVISLPTTSEQNAAASAIANWLARKLGVAQAKKNTIQVVVSGAQQQVMPTLYHRLANLREREYTIVWREVRDKEIVLVDDNITSGASIALIKHLLMRVGAKATHVFSLTKTGADPLWNSSQLLVPAVQRNQRVQNNLPVVAAAAPSQGEETLSQKVESWVLEGKTPWDGINGIQLSKPLSKMKDLLKRALLKPDIEVVAFLTEATLSRLTSEGKIIPPQGRGNLWKEIETDSAMQARVIQQLYDIRDKEVYAKFVDTPFIQKTIDMVQKQPAVNPLSNHLDADVLAWMRALPTASVVKEDGN